MNTTRRRAPRTSPPSALNWYSPVRYEDAVDLAPAAWLELLQDRARARNACPAEAQMLLEHFQRAPLASLSTFIPVRGPVNAVGFAEIEELVAQLVCHPSIARAHAKFRSMPEFMIRSLGARLGRIDYPAADASLQDLLLDAYRVDPAAFPDAGVLTTGYMQIDYTAPKAQLMAAAERAIDVHQQTLRAAGVPLPTRSRRGEKVAPLIDGVQTRRWAELRVLDYLDIELACRLESRAMPNAPTLGNMLFPSGVALRNLPRTPDHTDRIRKCTIPEVTRIMDAAFLDGFAAQVAAATLER